MVLLLFIKTACAEDNFSYDSKAKRNPFAPLVSEGGGYVSDAYGISGVKDIRLEGIVWDKNNGSVAIINGEIVREGQSVGAIKVLAIDKDAVIFDVDGEEVRIGLISE
ncbi:MAG: general secretion pathway protein GspB [Candidatus Omnitrophica bacterium]|nr:general secretion pathway protein GspB [Candidatus Omnitrophota bacterium]